MTLFKSIARWLPLRQARPPQVLRAWLGIQGSLTEALRRQCGGRVRAEVKQRKIMRADHETARLLGLQAGQGVLLREAFLYCGEQTAPWIFARTLIPLKDLESGLRRLKRLGERPIGERLFRPRRHVRREGLRIAQLEPPVNAGPHRLWARRSVLRQQKHKLLITEVLLPDLPQKQRRWRRA